MRKILKYTIELLNELLKIFIVPAWVLFIIFGASEFNILKTLEILIIIIAALLFFGLSCSGEEINRAIPKSVAKYLPYLTMLIVFITIFPLPHLAYRLLNLFTGYSLVYLTSLITETQYKNDSNSLTTLMFIIAFTYMGNGLLGYPSWVIIDVFTMVLLFIFIRKHYGKKNSNNN